MNDGHSTEGDGLLEGKVAVAARRDKKDPPSGLYSQAAARRKKRFPARLTERGRCLVSVG
ncbi:hypothetical protein L485_03535 [Sphingobium baderi LL03]|uniref:Uncharacterized protein n=1 Tax=Sphingobium baderi LL03 TaxID=1114964 RepID=T0I564_9SPHN|nr:hypothetical protein L485_03535 [Sphingobium baderi LL03]